MATMSLFVAFVIAYLSPIAIALYFGRAGVLTAFSTMGKGPKAAAAKEELAALVRKVENDPFREAEVDPSFLWGRKRYGTVKIQSFLSAMTDNWYLPVNILQLFVVAKFGMQRLYLLPVNMFEVWDWIFVVFAFHCASRQVFWLSLVIAVMILIANATRCLSIFGYSPAGPLLLTQKRNFISLSDIIKNGIGMMLAFACIYYVISECDRTAFASRPLSIIDSIYFSMVTAATVGYGDLSPASDTAKLIVILEIAASWAFVIIVVGSVLTTVLARNMELVKQKRDALPPDPSGRP